MNAGRTIRFLLVAVCFTAGNVPAVVERSRPRHPMRKEYLNKTFGKQAIGPVVGGAVVRRGPGGFGRHLATSFKGHVVKNSVEYSVAHLRHEDLHYHRSGKRGFGPRLKHALVSTVVTRKTTTGRKTVASGKLSGAAAAGLVAGGAATGGIAIGADAGANVAREFWPHKRKQVRRGPA